MVHLEIFENYLGELNYDAVRILQNSSSFRSRAPEPSNHMEVAMNDTPTLASAPHQAARPGMPVGLAEMPRRHYSLATLRSIIATWSERIRFRWELEQKLKDDSGKYKANAAMTPHRQFPRAAVVRRHLHLPEFAGPASKSA
jgi:hypothetical protein